MSLSPLSDNLIEFVLEWTGIQLERGKQHLLEQRIIRLLDANHLKNGDELAQKLKNNDPLIINQFLENITINETFWFRDIGVFKTIGLVLEDLIKERKRINVWSAACSYGQEPYSIAMHCHQKGLQHSIKIFATDLDHKAIDTADKGFYNSFAINRGLDDQLKKNYFTKKGEQWQINDEIRRMVNFKFMNLNNIQPLPEKADIILLRNVLIYFSKDKKKENLRKSRGEHE